MYINKLDEIVNKYNNTYQGTIKTKPVDVKPSIYIDFNKENNKEGPKFKVEDHARISKYQNIFAKGYLPNWSEEVFLIKRVKNTVPWTMLKVKKLLELFTKKNCRKQFKMSLQLKKQ